MNRVGNGGRYTRFQLATSLSQQVVQVKGTLIVERVATDQSDKDLVTQIEERQSILSH